MKCDKCGFVPFPGDQVCINCGAKLSLVNAIVPEVEAINIIEENTKDNKKLIIIAVCGVLLLIIVVFLVIKFMVLKD